MNSMKVSVIVPIYNAEKYIAKCIESVLNQSLKEIELILVNDGSSDTSYEICEKYSKKDERIILLDQLNAGSSAARNKGLNVAKGEYIEFVDADDYLEPDTIEILYKRAVESNSDVVIFGIRNVFPDSESFTKVKNDDYTLTEFLKHYGEYISNAIIGATCNKLYRHQCIKEIRFIEGMHHNEDLFFNLDALKKCKIISLQADLYYNYMHNGDSMSSRYIENLFDIYVVSNRKSTAFLKETDSYEYNLCAQNTRFVKQTIGAIIMMCKNSRTSKEKIVEIKNILNHSDVKIAIKNAMADGMKNKLMFLLIKHRLGRIIYFLCKFR